MLLVAAGCGVQSNTASDGKIVLTNVSYDPTRELYVEFNQKFVESWKAKTGQDVEIRMSHGGSGKQARGVIEGLEADVVTLALAYDIDMIADKGHLLPENWQQRLEHRSSPYTSTIVFLVRKGNPKGIKDWNDLVRSGIEVVTPNPKTSGGARWNYLAAWGYSLKQDMGDLAKVRDPKEADAVAKANAKAQEFVAKLFGNVKVLDSGARGSTITFVQQGRGDVLLAWENEAFLAFNEKDGADKLEIVVPSISILAEPPVALVDEVATRRGTKDVAEAYLKYLYSPEGQTIAAKNFYRPRSLDAVPAQYRTQFAKVDLFNIDDVFGGWKKTQKEHFDDGGLFDRIYQPKGK
jgi:sulfate transport system substrate-binding protein